MTNIYLDLTILFRAFISPPPLLEVYSKLCTACPLTWISANALQLELPSFLCPGWFFSGEAFSCVSHPFEMKTRQEMDSSLEGQLGRKAALAFLQMVSFGVG